MGKYTEEAFLYKKMVSNNLSKIDDIKVRIENIKKELKFDVENVKDILTYKTAVCSQEIETELESLTSNLNNYSKMVYDSAVEIDDRIEKELLRKQKEKEKANIVVENSIRTKEIF